MIRRLQISARTAPLSMKSFATATGNVNRRGPALPGFTNSTPSFSDDRRLVRVTRDDRRDAICDRIDIELRDVVQDVESLTADVDDCSRRQRIGPRGPCRCCRGLQ